MNQPNTLKSSNARNWRDIPQQVKPRAMSRGGRRRAVMALLRTVLVICVFVGLGAAGWWAYETYRQYPQSLTRAASLPPVKAVTLTTDGVLDENWVKRTLALPVNATLMELDLAALRDRLLVSGQVRAATLSRNFPETLVIHLSEHSPIARVMVQQPGGEMEELLVARDGSVYRGTGYEHQVVQSLVWLDGFTLARDGGRIQPIPGMEIASDLIAKAHNETPEIYATWRVVSLARLQSDGVIEVRATNIERIYFGTDEDFFRQLARLSTLLDVAPSQPDRPLREVNLSLGRTSDGRVQVPVKLDAPESAARPRATPPAASSSRLFNPPPRTAREF